MTDINELPTTPGGIRQMADVDMTVPFRSSAHKTLHAVYYSRNPTLRLRTARHVGMWIIQTYELPGIPSDGCVRLTLCFAGPADTV